MRNDVKLGLAVGGLLLGVVLAYALFFSNTNKDRKELADGSSALNNNSDASAQKPAAANTDQTATDSTPSPGAQPAPAPTDHAQPPVADTSSANPLIGKSWQLLLNEGATANSTGTL